jgi:hypothetical protein
MDTIILESKLKRHKISFSKAGREIIIGRAKKDLVDYIGLVIIPLVFGIGVVPFYLSQVDGIGPEIVHISAAAIFFIGIGSFNLMKRKRKRLANAFTKVFKDNKIIILTPEENYHLDKNTIKDIGVSNRPLGKKNHEGNLFVIDSKNRYHHILGFNDENEKYVEDDLKCFAEFILIHIGIKK